MKIRTRMCVSLDGYVSTLHGSPVQVADPAWSPEGCPLLVGGGLQLTPSLDLSARFILETERRLSTGAVEVVYASA